MNNKTFDIVVSYPSPLPKKGSFESIFQSLDKSIFASNLNEFKRFQIGIS